MSDLIGCERAVYSRAPDRLARAIGALRDLVTGRLVEDAGRPDATIDRAVMIRRLAGALTALFADPELELDADSADRLMPLTVALRQMFEIAGGDGLDLILRLLGNAPPGAPLGQLAKRFALLSLDSAFDWPVEMLGQAPPRLVQQLLASLIATKPVMTLRGQRRRDRLLERAASLPAAAFPSSLDHLVLITSAWMLCSYAGTPGKHAIKRQFNTRLRQIAADWRLHDAALPAVRSPKARPVLLFAAEIMHSGHVQYRYFGQYLRQLRTRFELVLLAEDKEVDEAVTGLFDRVLTFQRTPDGAYLGEIARMIEVTAPDIIFYPSVGMRHWGPLFANLRLAPIQLTALGHSASSFCDTIDYYLLEEGYVSDPALFGETVITVPDDSLIFERAPRYAPLAPAIRASPESLRIAVPSNILKLNPGFLATLAAIRQQATRPLEFHFMPNATGLEVDAARKMIGQFIPGAKVHPQQPYPRYLALLSDCDINLSPFPFGGLHSVIDSLRQGLPVVAMDCPEPHGRTDAMLLRRLAMPDWLIAGDEASYIAAALRIIGDDGLRVALGEQALALDIDRLMFGDATTELRSDVVDAVWWLYQHHEAVRADGRKLWSAADRARYEMPVQV
jgi:hypothetical protein